MDKSDIVYVPAAELSHLIKKKEVSPVEATEAYLDRIDHLDGRLNSYISVCRNEALQAAKEAEVAISSGNYLGPMHGIPVAVKDQFYTKGIRTTGGSTILANFVPNEDATVIANLKTNGAILLGKLNMSEFAMGEVSSHSYGTPHNPWDLERNPGTSSSGSGAATAAFLCATSLGEDTGGSVRGPAAFCGLVGLRPSYGRVSRYGMLGAVWSMDTAGPIARTVEDCAMTLSAIAGHDPKDPYTWNSSVPDYRNALDGTIRGVRVGMIRELVYSDVLEADVRDRVIKAIAHLGEIGASVEEVSLPLMVSAIIFYTIISQVEGASVHYRTIRERLKDFNHSIQVRQLVGSILPAQRYYRAQKLRDLLRRQILDVLKRVDVLVLPTSPISAPKIPTTAHVSTKEEVKAGYFRRRNFTQAAALAGVPAVSVPCGFTSSEPPLPIGLQIMGRPFEDSLVLKVAHAYEQHTPWHTERPPIA